MKPDQPAVDRERLLDQFEGDAELVREVAMIFLEDHPKQMRDIERGIANEDARSLETAAHTLKGSVGNFGAEAARQAAFELEELGRGANLARVGEVHARLTEEISRVVAELRVIVNEAA